MSGLTRRQKADVAILARKAWLASPEREAILAANPDYAESEAFTIWRRDKQREAVGVDSLRLVHQDDYLRLLAKFRDILGDTGRAVRLHVHAESEGWRRAWWLLQQSCQERGLAFPGYPGAICMQQYRCPLGEATEKQLWRLLYTVRNRRKAVAK